MTFSLGSTPRSLVKYNDQSISAITEVGSGAGITDDMVLIKEQTASSSSTVDFVDGTSDVVLDSTYPIYLFKFINIHPATDAVNFQFQTSTNTGSSYGVTNTSTAFTAYHQENGADTHFAYDTGADEAQTTNFIRLNIGSNIGNGNDESFSGELWLFGISSTTFVKHWMCVGNFHDSSSTAFSVNPHTAGYFNTTSALDAVQFKMHSGNIDAGTFKLYGIKDS